MKRLLARIERWRHWPVLALAITTYVPLLLTHRGKVGADTKTYLYLDPSKLLADAPWMWEPGVGLGTVTHQNIGYLWPMGPYYWVMDRIGLPDWVAQRLWLGTVLFAAGMGVRYLLRVLDWRLPGATIAVFAYTLTPYILHYSARISVILLPYAGLGWLIGLLIQSLRRGGWRYPAAFALVTMTVGGINATSLLLVLVGPALWLPYAVWAQRDVSLRQALAACARIGVLTAITSVWWVVGLSIQGRYGIPILRYTESYQVVAKASSATELFRGLGYWFFYGSDSLGPWISAATQMTEFVPILVVSFLVPTIALMTGLVTRFRYRAYFVTLLLVGMLISVASHPWDNPTPAGALFKAATEYPSGLAFRSTPRALPLVVLALAVLLGASVGAVAKLRPRWRTGYSLVLMALIFLNQAPMFTGNMVDSKLERAEDIPSYYRQLAADLDANAADRVTRVLEMPGIDFASYDWGNTVDPVTPGLIDRDYAARELIPYGSPASAALMNALDVPYQEGTSDPEALAPMLRLMGVGEVAYRADLRVGRYRTPRPRRLWHELLATPGIELEERYGPNVQNPPLDSVQPLEDEMELGTPTDWERPSPVSRFAVEDPEPMLRTVGAQAPVLMSGDASGLVNSAGFGLIDPANPVFFSADYTENPDALRALAAEPGAELIVTDTNRKQAWRWGSVRENHGYIERADEEPLAADITDRRLDVFPDAGWDAFTVAEPEGNATIDATGYGNAVTYTGGDRPVLAFDDNLNTSWKVGAFKEVSDDYVQITWPKPIDVSTLHLVQTQRASNNRWVTQVRVLFDGDEPKTDDGVSASLTEASRSPAGQTIEFSPRRTKTLRLYVEHTNLEDLASFDGVSEVGFAEIDVNDVSITDMIRPPVDMLNTLGDSAADRPLTYVFQRAASNPEEVVIDDEEWQMQRLIDVPNDREFTLDAKARLATELPDDQIDALIGVMPAAQGGVTARSKSRLPAPMARAYSAADNDPQTAWQSPVNQGIGQWIEYESANPITVKNLNLQIVADGQHSVPRVVHLEVDDKASEPIRLPAEFGDGTDRSCTDDEGDANYDLDGNERGRTLTFEAALSKPLRGKTVRLVVDDLWQECSRDWFGGGPTVLPVGIAELGVPGLTMPPVPAELPDTCHDTLLNVDEKPVSVRLAGSAQAALERQLVDVFTCDSQPLALDAGQHRLSTAGATILDKDRRALTGFSIDLLSLRSDVNRAEQTVDRAPTLASTQKNRLSWDVRVRDGAATSPYWVVLGQSFNAGWHLRTADGTDLGPSKLVNGYANGWLIDPAKVDARSFTLEWTPQRQVWFALVVSLIGVAICLVCLAFTPRRVARATSVSKLLVISPLDRFGSGPSTTAQLTTVAATLVFGVIALGPIVGPLVALMTGLALRYGWGWAALRVLAATSLGMSVAYVVLKQTLNAYALTFDWGQKFAVTHYPMLLAVALCFADVMVETLRGSWRREVGHR